MRHAVPVDLRQSTRKMKNWKKPDGVQTVKNCRDFRPEHVEFIYKVS